MKEIFILEETWGFIAWKKSPITFYVQRKSGELRVIELVRALCPQAPTWKEPSDIDPDPVRISPCLLLPPPPYLGPHEILDDWQKVYLETHSVSRPYLDGADDEPLQKALDAYKADQRVIYERDLEIAEKIHDVEERAQEIQRLRFKYEAPADVIKDPYELEYKEAQEIEDAVERARAMQSVRLKYEGSENQAEDPPCFFEGSQAVGILNTTLEMVRAGAGVAPSGLSIRDDYLFRYWANRKGVDLDEMARQRREYYEWLQKHAGNLDSISNLVKREKRVDLRSIALHGLNDPRFLECCARVRYRCQFEDGSSAYLQEFKYSTPQLPEIHQLANLLEGARSRSFREPEHEPAKTPSKELSKKRAAAGHKAAKVRLKEDRKKIKAAFLVRANGGLSDSSAAREVADLAGEDENTLELADGPYYVSPDTIKRIAGVRKNK